MTVFEVLAEPNRRRILDLLRERQQPVGDLVRTLAISQPAVSRHLRVLREAGFVAAQVDAQRRIYSVRGEPLRELDEWLAPYRAMWSDSLDALARHLQEMDEPTPGAAHGRSESKTDSKARRKTK